jgi:hypothetical protein
MNKIVTLLLAGAFAVAAATGASAQSKLPFGGDDDVAFANKLWAAMTEARLVGPNALKTTTYQGGTGLHATTLTLLQGMVTVGGNTGLAIVKNNFLGAEGKDVTDADIIGRPQDFAGPATVMYQRKGYDPDNQNWFWAVFKPNGEVVVNPKGMTMAGRIVGGGAMPDAPFNCVACHKLAPGNDMVYVHDAVPEIK